MNVFEGISLPKVIYETESPYNGHIQVIQVGATRKIRVDKIDQSLNWDSKSCGRLVWGKTRDLLMREVPDLNSLLIFGLGGGTMQHLIAQTFNDIQIVSVEIDKEMIDIANRFFDLGSVPNHSVICADAFRVVSELEKYELSEFSFDAVMVDIFTGERFPDLGNSGSFVGALKRLVVPAGLIVFNRIYREHHQDSVNNFIEYLETTLKNVKSEVVAGYTNSDNVLIFGRT